jgi:DNA-directed RNA polymerase subunit RPC12/RpoP
MIRVELPVVVLIYFFVLLIALFLLSILYEWRNQKREKEALRYRVHCTICASIFEDKTDADLIRCPRCGSLNERQRTGGL